MKRQTGRLIAAVLMVGVCAFLTMTGAADVRAQTEGLTKQMEGTWTLVSNINERDGRKTDAFGPNPRGRMVLTPGGRFSIIVTRASLPRFASNNRMKGTVEENQAVAQGSHATFGTYRVASEKEKTVIFHIEVCTFPNWDGQDQSRVVTVSGKELKMTIPVAALGGTNHLVWKRVE